MSEVRGGCGRSGRHYGDELAVLYGVLTMEPEAVYPDNYCPFCAKDGVDAGDKCFHRHWNKEEATNER